MLYNTSIHSNLFFSNIFPNRKKLQLYFVLWIKVFKLTLRISAQDICIWFLFFKIIYTTCCGKNQFAVSDAEKLWSAVYSWQKLSSKWKENILPDGEPQLTRDTNSVTFRKLHDTSFPLSLPSSVTFLSDLNSLIRWRACTPCLSWTQLGWWGASSRPHGGNGGWNLWGAPGSNRSLSTKANMTFLWPAAGITKTAGSHACRHTQTFIPANLTWLITMRLPLLCHKTKKREYITLIISLHWLTITLTNDF